MCDSLAMDQQPMYCGAIEAKIDLLATSIVGKSSPVEFGGHIVGRGFMKLPAMLGKVQVQGDTPHMAVHRLLEAVVAAISTASSPQSCADWFDRFVRVVREDLEMVELGQQILDELKELERRQCPVLEAQPSRFVPMETTRPALDSARDQSQEFLTKEEAEKKCKALRNRFDNLVGDTQDYLIDSEQRVSRFCTSFLPMISGLAKQEYEAFFKANAKYISSVESFQELFIHLSLFWNYLNYGLLKCIINIKVEENDELKHKIDLYSAETEDFKSKTKLHIFWEMKRHLHFPFDESPPAEFRAVLTRLDISSQSTLKDLEEIRLKVTKVFRLPTFAIMLVDVVPGSVLVTWLVPHSVASMMLSGLSSELREELHIISMDIVEHSTWLKGKPLSAPPLPPVPEALSPAAATAAAAGSKETAVESIETANTSLDVSEQGEHTALMKAAMNGQSDTVKSLVAAGADVNTLGNWNTTALMLASEKGHADSLKILLDARAETSIQNKSGDTALILASENGHTEALKLLVEAGADFGIQNESGDTPLILASTDGHTEALKFLLKKGADFSVQNQNGETAVMLASENGHAESLKLFLNKRPDCNVKNKWGQTALMMACENGRTDCVKLLIKAGAKLNIGDESGETALMMAAYKGHTESLKLLLKAQADLTNTNKWGKTALVMASESTQIEALRLLLEAGADEMESKETLLLCYVLLGSADKVRELVVAGADFKARYKTIFKIAVQRANPDVMRVLIEAKDTSYREQLESQFGYSETAVRPSRTHSRCSSSSRYSCG